MKRHVFFSFQILVTCFSFSLVLAGCTVNPATGDRQFTAFMSPDQEVRIGAAEHEKIMQLFGGSVKDQQVVNYVESIGKDSVPYTERPEVDSKFYVLDSPVVNAFALPGGYVYVSRGLVGLANTEAQLASVVGHEIGHITGRHSAERYSQSILASLGTSVLGAAVDTPGATDLARLGSQLYLSSYSREQENQADDLGIRYIARAGYDPLAASRFLTSLKRQADLTAKMKGKEGQGGFGFFATHPKTENRVQDASNIALATQASARRVNRDKHLNVIDGMIYGNSPEQGFAVGDRFVHPKLGITFTVPEDFEFINNPAEVLAVSENDGIIIFDGAPNSGDVDTHTYLTRIWMGDETLQNVETIDINGKEAVTASFRGTVRGKSSNIRVVAIRWSQKRFYRFIMAIPQAASEDVLQGYKRTTYSFRELTAQDKRDYQPRRIKVITAQPDDTVNALAARQAFEDFSEDWFRVLNGMEPQEDLKTGERYKLVIR